MDAVTIGAVSSPGASPQNGGPTIFALVFFGRWFPGALLKQANCAMYSLEVKKKSKKNKPQFPTQPVSQAGMKTIVM